jgi:hypothetical protein
VTWFSVLTVEVNERELTAWFGFGRPRKVVPRSAIVKAERVRLPWHYGTGVKWNSTAALTLGKVRVVTYLAWPGDGVSLTMTNGPLVQIGTDDPDGLLKALAAPQPA